MEKLDNCPVCNSSRIAYFLSSQDYFLTQESFSIDKCLDCETKFTNPRPTEINIPQYYESDDYISHSDSPKGLIDKLYYFIRKYSISSKVRLVKKYVKSGKALDVGCGTGQFLNELKNKGFEVTGIEPNNSARKIASDSFGLTVYNEEKINELKKNSFQVISLWHVLEHVKDLNQRIQQLKKLLAPNGVVIVAVPNPDSWDAKHYGKFWAAYDLPRHLYHFNSSSIQNLFKKAGFILIEKRPLYFDSFYISLLSEKYKAGKSNFVKAMFFGLISNFYAMMSEKNYSSVIYILKNE